MLTPTDFDSVVVFNTGMSVAKTFGTPGALQPEVSATNLFPFASPYAVYAGNCAENNPNPGGEPEPPPAIEDALVSRGGVTPVTLALPPLDLTVWSGEGESEPGEPVEGAQVEVADTRCKEGEEGEETSIVRTYTTNEAGGLDDPGLPFSNYGVCVEYGEKHIAASGVSVPEDPADIEAGTTLDFFIANPETETGPCP